MCSFRTGTMYVSESLSEYMRYDLCEFTENNTSVVHILFLIEHKSTWLVTNFNQF